LPIVEALAAEGAVVAVHDPVALEKAEPLLPEGVRAYRDLEKTLRDAAAALLLTEWPDNLALDGYRLLGTALHRREKRIASGEGIGTGAAEAALVT
jgi:UDP-glucose 6-dehydrogenase